MTTSSEPVPVDDGLRAAREPDGVAMAVTAMPRVLSIRLTLALVGLSLLSIALLPLLLHRYTRAQRSHVLETADPALELVTRIQGALALQIASARGFALTADSAYLAPDLLARADRQHAEGQLLPLAARLGPAVYGDAIELGRQTRAADETVDSLFARQLSVEAYASRLPAQQRRLERSIASGQRISSAVRQSIVESGANVSRAERFATAVGGLLVLLALVAVLMVARLGQRYRDVALQLAERQRDLERVTQSRTRLIRGFSHDVKNPLGAADGHLALVAEGIHGSLTPKQEESIERARRAIHNALDLMGQLVEIARAEAGQIEIRAVAMDVRQVLRDVVDEFRAQADVAGLQLRLEEGSEPMVLASDPARVRQVLANLLSNAIKFTPSGGRVIVRADRAHGRRASEADWVVASVKDTGPGIPAGRLRELFLEFARLDPSAAPGSGIGLAISQRIAGALGGHIAVESTPGAGSTFALWLPASDRNQSGSKEPR